jgi:hypothetical protein
MKQKLITARSPSSLNEKIKQAEADGWEAIGSHTAVQLHAQLKYAGKQHMETEHKAEYAQTIRKINQ